MHAYKSDLIICKNRDFQTLRRILARHTKRAYFVGGCVRDSILGRKCKDFDIEIYDINPHKFDNLMQKIGAKGVGKSFFVYKYKNFDLALARKESKIFSGHRGFKVSVCDDEKLASSRRDFTINSLMCDIFSGKVLDFWGGLDDLKNKTLRITNEKSFCEDSLRVLRGAQFVARFGLNIDEKSLAIMRKICIDDLSFERVKIELEKLFCAPHLELGLELLNLLNLDEKIFQVKLNKNFIKKAKKHFIFSKNPLSVPYDIFCEYGKCVKGFESVCKYEVIKKVSRKNLLNLSLKMPLKFWLGLNSQKRKNLAIKLGVYSKKLSLNLDNEILKKMSVDERTKYIKIAKQKAIVKILERKK